MLYLHVWWDFFLNIINYVTSFEAYINRKKTIPAVWNDEHLPDNVAFDFPNINRYCDVYSTDIRKSFSYCSHITQTSYLQTLLKFHSHCTIFFACAKVLTHIAQMMSGWHRWSGNIKTDLVSPPCCWHHDWTKGKLASSLVILDDREVTD